MSANQTQAVSLVAEGGIPIRITDQTGAPYPTTGFGALVLSNSPMLITPIFSGPFTVGAINKVTITPVPNGATFTLADGKTFVVNNTLTLSGTDGAILNIGGGGALGSAAYQAATAFVQPTVTGNFTAGYTFTAFNAGTVSSGTFTPAAATGNYQYLTNNGAFTLQAPASDSAIVLLIVNGPTAGAITFSGFTVGATPGDPLTTANASRFLIDITRINGISTYIVKALQ